MSGDGLLRDAGGLRNRGGCQAARGGGRGGDEQHGGSRDEATREQLGYGKSGQLRDGGAPDERDEFEEDVPVRMAQAIQPTVLNRARVPLSGLVRACQMPSGVQAMLTAPMGAAAMRRAGMPMTIAARPPNARNPRSLVIAVPFLRGLSRPGRVRWR